MVKILDKASSNEKMAVARLAAAQNGLKAASKISMNFVLNNKGKNMPNFYIHTAFFWHASTTYEVVQALNNCGGILYRKLVNENSSLKTLWSEVTSEIAKKKPWSVGLLLHVIRKDVAFHFTELPFSSDTVEKHLSQFNGNDILKSYSDLASDCIVEYLFQQKMSGESKTETQEATLEEVNKLFVELNKYSEKIDKLIDELLIMFYKKYS